MIPGACYAVRYRNVSCGIFILREVYIVGGRGRAGGGNGRKILAFDVNMDGAIVNYVLRNGKVYRNDGELIALQPKKVIENAKKLGYSVKTYNKKEYEEREKARKEDRRITDEFLSRMDVQIGGNRREQRMELIGNRAAKRRRR